MREYVFFLILIVLGALANGASISTIIFVMVLAFMLYSIGSKSTADITKVQNTASLGSIAEDLGYISASVMKGKSPSVSVKNVVNSTTEVVSHAQNAFK